MVLTCDTNTAAGAEDRLENLGLKGFCQLILIQSAFRGKLNQMTKLIKLNDFLSSSRSVVISNIHFNLNLVG